MLYLAPLNSFEKQRDKFKSAPTPPAFCGWSLAPNSSDPEEIPSLEIFGYTSASAALNL